MAAIALFHIFPAIYHIKTNSLLNKEIMVIIKFNFMKPSKFFSLSGYIFLDIFYYL